MERFHLLDCCDFTKINFSKMNLSHNVDWLDVNFQVSLFLIIFNPIYWNVVARLNYKTKFLEKIFFGPKWACRLLAITIIILGLLRSWFFRRSLLTQPLIEPLFSVATPYIAFFLIAVGFIFVSTSYLSLGFYGTFLGDHFGIFLPARVTSFPFNLLDNPMYFGSTLNFLGTALLYNSETGLFLAIAAATVYSAASIVEEQFTEMIYRERKAL